MTPKEKAKELFLKDHNLWIFGNSNMAKQSALIAVDDIINCTKNGLGTTKFSKEYWQEVKQEIENL